MNFARYAIYFVPPAQSDWSRFATAWLGWDIDAGRTVDHPTIDGLDVASVTQVPRKYGLHATMKPPFRLREDQSLSSLQDTCARLAGKFAPVLLDRLEVARLGRFLALRPVGDTRDLNALAAACVRDLDPFRAPASETEMNRRRAAGLTMEQDANLTNWGYPYVLEAFRFHITLSGRLSKPMLANVQTVLNQRLVPLLPAPFDIRDLALVGEAEDGRFHMLQRYALSG
ncbi:DUF1045 domain-containing protein [Ruegeria arenilitoris]|uniref:Phosphonate metabolism protein n=1 Tax=Ruegeria arenilitoris TaxID=1173585 RepID=A0A238KXG8_9RHOB|nr:DUF1045 domain-containing protein [Ruegeria arenilitoris]SMX47271.1 hypothetical protein RUA8715_03043 [Ruegeria arenilitoris]